MNMCCCFNGKKVLYILRITFLDGKSGLSNQIIRKGREGNR